MGDFNFPVLWNTDSLVVNASTTNELNLINFMDEHFLCQYIDTATRGVNILDLLLSNNEKLVCHLDTEKHPDLSDHDIINISLPSGVFSASTQVTEPSVDNLTLVNFRELNLFEADLPAIIQNLENVDWKGLWSKSCLEDFPKVLQETVINICKRHAPLKIINKSSPSKFERSYRTLQRKKRKLNSRLQCIKSNDPS